VIAGLARKAVRENFIECIPGARTTRDNPRSRVKIHQDTGVIAQPLPPQVVQVPTRRRVEARRREDVIVALTLRDILRSAVGAPAVLPGTVAVQPPEDIGEVVSRKAAEDVHLGVVPPLPRPPEVLLTSGGCSEGSVLEDVAVEGNDRSVGELRLRAVEVPAEDPRSCRPDGKALVDPDQRLGLDDLVSPAAYRRGNMDVVDLDLTPGCADDGRDRLLFPRYVKIERV